MSKQMPTNVVSLAERREGITPNVPHHADTLSFMKKRKPRGSGIDHWAVKPSGKYGEDCEAGKRLAAEYLTHLGNYPTEGNATLLGCIVRDMIEHAAAGEPWNGVQTGFLIEVNRFAMSTAKRYVQG